jgi:hypothetical protein
MSQPNVKSMAYDHPAYTARLTHSFPAIAAGASGVTSKFIAFSNLILYGIRLAAVAIGAAIILHGLEWYGDCHSYCC